MIGNAAMIALGLQLAALSLKTSKNSAPRPAPATIATPAFVPVGIATQDP